MWFDAALFKYISESTHKLPKGQVVCMAKNQTPHHIWIAFAGLLMKFPNQ
jgi:hypothetical protein